MPSAAARVPQRIVVKRLDYTDVSLKDIRIKGVFDDGEFDITPAVPCAKRAQKKKVQSEFIEGRTCGAKSLAIGWGASRQSAAS